MTPPSPASPSALCRDCSRAVGEDLICPACRSARQIAHPELISLGVAHIDCDAFFASIEKRDRPELAEQPVLVGGGQRGVVAACCYIARSYGIRSAMPMFKARKLCPHAVVVRPEFAKYKAAAETIRAMMRDLTPLVQPASIDEAYLDLTGTERLHGAPPAATLATFARAVERDVGITVSIGLSHNKLLAKIASDLDKPRGFAVLGRHDAAGFLAPQPVTLLPGIGAAFAAKLNRDGVRTLGDLQQCDPAKLLARYGEHGLGLASRACGEDSRAVEPNRETKSISGETTFGEDLSARGDLEDRLYMMARKVSARAKEAALAGRVVTLKLKTTGFRSLTRRRTLPHATNLAHVIFETGRELLDEELGAGGVPRAFRLIGIGISDLVEADLMDDGFLFSEDHQRMGRRESAVDDLTRRFGDGVIGTARDHRLAKPRKD